MEKILNNTRMAEVSRIAKELKLLNILLNAIDLQYFSFLEIHKKPNKIRIFLLIFKFNLIIFFFYINLEDLLTVTIIGSFVMSIIYGFSLVIWFLLFISSLFQTYRATPDIKCIYLIFEEIVEFSEENGVNFCFKKFQRRVLIRFFFLTAFIVITFFISDDLEKLFDFFLEFTLFPTLILSFFIFYYVYLVDLSNQLLRLLTTTIDKILKTNRTYEIQNYRLMYYKISYCVQLINQNFGFSIMLCLCSQVLELILSGYKLIISIKDTRELPFIYGEYEYKIK